MLHKAGYSWALLGLSLGLPTAGHAEWQLQQNPATQSNFRSVKAVSREIAWIGGSGGTCLRTVDGGRTWESRPVPGAEKLDFRGIAAFDAKTAVVVSAGEASEGKARVYRTEDGGQKWQLVYQTTEKGAFMDGTAFWDRKHGLIVGDPIGGKWFLLRTDNGGRHWTRVDPKTLPDTLPNEGAFASSNSTITVRGSTHAWIASGASERARVFRSIDRGKTWETAETPMPSGMPTGPVAGIFGLHFWDDLHGIGVGGNYKQLEQPSNNVILTADGGKTWELGTPTTPPGAKESAVLLADGVLLAIGPAGTGLSRDGGRSWQAVADAPPLHAVSCAGGRCWGVGKGTIARWD